MRKRQLTKDLDWCNYSRAWVLKPDLGSLCKSLRSTPYAHDYNTHHNCIQHLESQGQNLQLLPRCLYPLWNRGWSW
jgi:hypothetical protein